MNEIDEKLELLLRGFLDKGKNLFHENQSYLKTFEGGRYACAILKPSKRMRSNLGADREILVISSTFVEQQQRSVKFIQSEIASSKGRLEPSVAIIIHLDPEGNAKLRNWGRDVGISVLPIDGRRSIESAEDIESRLAAQLYAHDPFDVTGPVSGDQNFFGRRDEAIDLSRKLQTGQIRSCLGIRKVGKTSIINRVLAEIPTLYRCTVVMVDCSKDDVFDLTAEQLLQSLADTIEVAETQADRYASLSPNRGQTNLAEARNALERTILGSHNVILIVLDEADYITPGSPTAGHWRSDFNRFWRNFRAIYQECDRKSKKVSLLIGGVSSYWFTVEAIDGIENAALAFIPEEFLSPMATRASIAMLKRLGKISGIDLTDNAAQIVAEETGNMPYWSRKCCSFVHRSISVTKRPIRIDEATVRPLIDRFITEEGVSIAEVALSHLFRVHPLLQDATRRISRKEVSSVSPISIRTLERYGIINRAKDFSGQMLRRAFENIELRSNTPESKEEEGLLINVGGLTDWAEDLATLGVRRNVVEKKLRGIVLNFLRVDAMSKGSLDTLKQAILKPCSETRRKQLAGFALDDVMQRLTWLELTDLIQRNWDVFSQIFGDKSAFRHNMEIVNDRPDTHAKEVDRADVALHRRSLAWFEERLAKLQ